ncbi:MAG: hypothetical protein ACYTFA_15405, partial [Planctomycetota bacterium]
MTGEDRAKELFARYVEHHVVHGERLVPEELCEGNAELFEPLRDLIRQYEVLDETLTASLPTGALQTTKPDEPLPTFQGFRTIERVGSGGGGAVYKLEDLELGRVVAGKVVHSKSLLSPG